MNVEPCVRYRERGDRILHSTLRLDPDDQLASHFLKKPAPLHHFL